MIAIKQWFYPHHIFLNFRMFRLHTGNSHCSYIPNQMVQIIRNDQIRTSRPDVFNAIKCDQHILQPWTNTTSEHRAQWDCVNKSFTHIPASILTMDGSCWHGPHSNPFQLAMNERKRKLYNAGTSLPKGVADLSLCETMDRPEPHRISETTTVSSVCCSAPIVMRSTSPSRGSA